uniref:Acid ceramidase N-terminal domain-containing protein n=1 Tax=Cyprinodon variegatus TaxID=28743 RepID=A0A3Q2DRN0_CYPVA
MLVSKPLKEGINSFSYLYCQLISRQFFSELNSFFLCLQAWVKMMLSTGLLVLLGLAGSLWAQHVPPTVVINLDLSPEQRWKPLQDVTLIPKWMHQAFGPLIKSLEKHVSHPYIEEIHGIARWTKINPADILILNYAYEFTAYCTSIVAQDRRGYIYHGRNFDYSYPVLRDLTMNVVFFKNGKV